MICNTNSIIICYIKHVLGALCCFLFFAFSSFSDFFCISFSAALPSFPSLLSTSPLFPFFLSHPFIVYFLKLDMAFSVLLKEWKMKLMFKQHFHVSLGAYLNANCSYNNSVPLLLWVPFCV